MSQTTPKLGLKQPFGNESVSREAYNENLRLMDQNAASQAEVDEPFFLKTVVYHTANHRIDLTLGPGRAAFLGVMVAKIGDSTLSIDLPAPNTAYYIFITKEGDFTYNSTNIDLPGAVPIWSVNTGDSISDITTQDLRGKLPGAAARIVQDNLMDHAVKAVLAHPDDSVSDAKIGSRTVVDGVAPNDNSGSLTVILGWFANLFKTITGETDWKTVPGLNLKTAKAKIAESAPPGQIAYFARSTAPPGWLKANGAAVSRTAYADLFAAIGTTFGLGDGSTTFNLPDLRGEFLRAWDDGRGIDPGRGLGNWQSDGFRYHEHPLKTQTGTPGNDIVFNDCNIWNRTTPNEYAVDPNGLIDRVATFGAGGSETRPRNVALLACVKY
jgi:microcystin-dependent protein